MKIILLKSVPNLGQAGEVKEVSGGFARNHLIPGGLADIASRHSLGLVAAKKKKIERLNIKAATDKQKLAGKLDRKVIVIKAKADQSGTLYAGISARSLALELLEQGFAVEASEIRLAEAIKKTGSYKAELDLGGAKAKIKLKVEQE